MVPLSVLLLVVFLLSCWANNERVEVHTELGTILGTTMVTPSGEVFQAYRGIRYAEAPVGPLRFVNPLPVKSWKPQIMNATVDGPMCPQVIAEEYSNQISEDCLMLNVYTKNVNARKPVIVFLHPGGYYYLSGQSQFYGPQYFMERDVVLVSLNYRLGTLGFLATGTSDAPGNAGLKDQVEALRWIQKHIINFGGDPKSVTLLGNSAGSWSVGLHMLSPMSRGLFHRSIAMSGSPLGQWEYHNDGLLLATRQAQLLDCPQAPLTKLVECLRKKPFEEFVNTHYDMFDFKWNPTLNWEPVIEPDFGQERFLQEDPMCSVQRGNFNKVPLITGITEFENLYFADLMLRNESTRRLFVDNFKKYAPIAFLYGRNKNTEFDQITEQISSFYLKNETLRFPESLTPFGQMYSDNEGFYRFLHLMSAHVPVYTYMFTYKGRYSHYILNNRTQGPVHHDDMQYLMHVGYFTPILNRTDPEYITVERMTRMWAEFATKGDPNNCADEYLKDVHWPLYTPDMKEYLNIGNKLRRQQGGIYLERYLFWEKLFPLSHYKNGEYCKQLSFQ